MSFFDDLLRGIMVEPPVGLEPTTFTLQKCCSTTELRRPFDCVRAELFVFDEWPVMRKLKALLEVFEWWAGMDSNHRRRCQRIYSPPRLTTSVPTHVIFEEAVDLGADP